MRDGFFRVAAATPQAKVAEADVNAERIVELIKAAAEKGCGAVCLPELTVTAYTCGDLFQSRTLISAAEKALGRILEETRDLDILCVLGMPVAVAVHLRCIMAVRRRCAVLPYMCVFLFPHVLS